MSGVSDEAVIAVRDKLRGKIGKTKLVKRYWPHEWADKDRGIDMGRRGDSSRQLKMVKRDDDDPMAENRLDNKEEVKADQQRRQEDEDEDEMVVIEEVEVEEEEDSGCETTTDSEKKEEQTGIMDIVKKPVDVPKDAEWEISVEELMKRRVEEMKKIAVEAIMIHDNNNLELEAAANDVDTDDELNEAEEYEAWKARERARIQRYREDPDMRWSSSAAYTSPYGSGSYYISDDDISSHKPAA